MKYRVFRMSQVLSSCLFRSPKSCWNRAVGFFFCVAYWLTDWPAFLPPPSWFFSTTAPFSQLQHHKNWCRERLDICSNLYSTACRKQRICWLIPLDSRYAFFFGFAPLIESLHWFPVHNLARCCFSGACWLVIFLNCDLLFWFSRKNQKQYPVAFSTLIQICLLIWQT